MTTDAGFDESFFHKILPHYERIEDFYNRKYLSWFLVEFFDNAKAPAFTGAGALLLYPILLWVSSFVFSVFFSEDRSSSIGWCDGNVRNSYVTSDKRKSPSLQVWGIFLGALSSPSFFLFRGWR
jgi:hypothetical protein